MSEPPQPRPPKPPFDLLRAVFFLLAFVIVIQMLATVLGGLLCWYVNFTSTKQPGACISVSTIIREVWGEILTAVLALLLAGRPPP